MKMKGQHFIKIYQSKLKTSLKFKKIFIPFSLFFSFVIFFAQAKRRKKEIVVTLRKLKKDNQKGKIERDDEKKCQK